MGEIACGRCEKFSPRIEEITSSGQGNINLYKCGNCGAVINKGTERETLKKMEEVAERLGMRGDHHTLHEFADNSVDHKLNHYE